jgi:hypothetical protein
MYELLLMISDAVGILGVIIILIAYYLLSVGRWPANCLSYQWLNFIGAWLILFSLYFHWNTASVLIEVAWIIISLIGIYGIYYPKKEKK